MSADADHEVIDSPEALFHHLYEAHHVEEALDLDPETAPVQFWLRRHAELERQARAAPRPAEPAPRPAEPAPRPAAAGLQGRRPAPFGDPLVEAVTRALAGRGHDEAAVRGAIRGYTSLAGGRTGEAAVRGDFVEPMLRAAAERLLDAGEAAGPPPPAARAPAAPPQPTRPAAGRRRANPPAATQPEPGRPPADRTAAAAREADRPEAAWAGLWADLGDVGTRRAPAGGAAVADDELMAIADAVQRRKQRRRGEREPGPLRR
jgi:hypothetical protein